MDKNELMELADDMQTEMGTDEFLLAIIKQMSSDELQDALSYINRCYDLDFDI